MKEEPYNKILKDRFFSLIADGVDKFPQAAQNNTIIQKKDISTCNLCDLAKTRKRVCVSNEFLEKKYFVLAEFPHSSAEDTDNKFLFSETSTENIIIKLLQKLKIIDSCYFAFALKCVPHRGIPQHALTICAQNNLQYELTMVKPEIILCFGYKALAALANFDNSLLNAHLSENFSILSFNFINSVKKVIYLSASKDLHNFPQWRNQVWDLLSNYF